jgi:hypothetical protein
LKWQKSSSTEENFQDFVQNFGASTGRILRTLQNRHQPINLLSYPSEPCSVVWEDSWSMEKMETRDSVGSDLVKKLGQELKRNGAKFTDPLFPSEACSLFVDPSQRFQDFLDGHFTGNIVWKRPSQLFPDKELKVLSQNFRSQRIFPSQQ